MLTVLVVSSHYISDSVSPIFDSAIGHNSGLVNVSPEYSAIKVDPSKISSSKDTVGKSSTFQEGICQLSISQISPTKTGRDQASPTQISPTQISPIQVGLNQTNISQVSSTEINSGHVTFGDILPTEIYPTQIHSFGFGKANNIWSKVSNSTGIETKNFLVADDSSVVHDSLFQLAINIQNTTLPIWTEFRQSPTPFKCFRYPRPKHQWHPHLHRRWTNRHPHPRRLPPRQHLLPQRPHEHQPQTWHSQTPIGYGASNTGGALGFAAQPNLQSLGQALTIYLRTMVTMMTNIWTELLRRS